MNPIPPHIPAETHAHESRSNRVSRAVILSLIVGTLSGFVASILYAAYGPTSVSHLETRVERAPEGWDSRAILAAQEGSVALVSELKQQGTKSLDTGETLGYGTVVTSDGWVVTVAPAAKGKYVLSRTTADSAIEKSVADPASPLVFVKTAAKNLRVLNQGSLASLPRGTKLAIVTPQTSYPVTLQDQSTCISDHCPWEYADHMSYVASVAEALPGAVVDGAPVIDSVGALVGVAMHVSTGVVVIPVSQIQPLFQNVFLSGVITRSSLPVRALNLTRWPVIDPTNQIPDRGFYIETLPHAAAATLDLKDGDVITRINNEPVDADSNLFELIRGFQPDDSVPMTVLRKGVSQDISVKLAPLTNAP